jgi:hypothetical protein
VFARARDLFAKVLRQWTASPGGGDAEAHAAAASDTTAPPKKKKRKKKTASGVAKELGAGAREL